MSIEQLESDTKAVVSALPTGGLISAADMAAFMKNNFLPLFTDLVDELKAMDGAIADLASGAVEILHRDNASVFLALIEGGAKVIADLKAKLLELGGKPSAELDQAIKEWNTLAEEGREILEEVTFVDTDDDEDQDDENPADEESPKDPGK